MVDPSRTFIVFRPEPGCGETCAALEARGFRAIPSPALIVEDARATAPDLTGVVAVAVTSAAGAKAGAGLHQKSGAPLYAVGAATARALREAGAQDVRRTDGDGAAVAARIAVDIPTPGAILHPCGKDVRPGLQERLETAGFVYRPHVVYRAVPAMALSASAETLLRDGPRPYGVILTSPRTARIAERLFIDGGFGALRGDLVAYGLSRSVLDELETAAWGGLRSPSSPNMAALLDLLPAGG